MSHASFELSPNVYLMGCPFLQQDSFQFAPLIETLKEQLSTKIKGQDSCQGQLQAVYQGFQSFYNQLNIDPNLKQKIADEALQNYLNDLRSQKTNLELSNNTQSTEYSLILQSISTIETRLLDNKIDLVYENKQNEAYLNLQMKSSLLNYSKNILSALNQTWMQNPRCFDQLNLAQLLPAALQTASLATGIQSAATASAASEVLSGFVQLLNYKKVRRAYNELIRFNNQQTLACTYYAALYNTCEYRRGLQLSKNVALIKKQVERLQETNDPLFETWARMNERKKIFSVAFNQVASSASGLLTNIQQLTNYFLAKRNDPFSKDFPVLPEPSNEEQKITWLNALELRGMDVPDFANGIVLTPTERVEQAKVIIETQKGVITSVESAFKKNRNFTELRNNLEVVTPTIRKDTDDMLRLIETFSGVKKSDESKLISPIKRGPLFSAMRIFTALEDFLSVPIDQFQDFDSFNETLAQKGGSLYEQMAYNSIGAINTQVLLVLGSKATERLENSLTIIRNYLFEQDEFKNSDSDKFSTYLRDRAMLAYVIQNYTGFQATGQTFRGEASDVFFKSFEKGFRQEMIRSLNTAFDEKNDRISETTGVTASHLCALYAESLKNMGDKGAMLLKKCKDKFKTLQLYSITNQPHAFETDFSDGCTYINYTRQRKMEELMINLKLGI